LAHGGGGASLIVPIDHINPGEGFPVIAADFGPQSAVTFSIVATERSAALGSATAGPDGHFDAHFDLPADFPLGYADLVARADDGSQTDVYVLVGPATNATPPRPRRVSWWQDPSVLLLGLVVLVGSVVTAAALVQARRRERATAQQRSVSRSGRGSARPPRAW